MLPKPPKHILPYAKACLEALSEAGLASFITLGGAFELAYWAEYRPTHLDRIERSRPLDSITDISQREEAAKIREWHKKALLGDDYN